MLRSDDEEEGGGGGGGGVIQDDGEKESCAGIEIVVSGVLPAAKLIWSVSWSVVCYLTLCIASCIASAVKGKCCRYFAFQHYRSGKESNQLETESY
ncbi:hypothetical protein T07_8573 [Trichinella nelsoni]|uniref:Transmembrane protein n=1 Tax=Trichinella nelsoni TaxID=6336 RepID=A0A0V0RL99_9BILA|nr:hypothetical protein T07_8573 [Trichinella nelsoni]